MDEQNDLFVCIEVESNAKMSDLAKNFDNLFPGRPIRLKVNGIYSPMFYIGGSKWAFKPKKNKYNFSFKILTNETSDDYLDDHQVEFLNYLKVDIDSMKLIADININNVLLPGVFFSNGSTHFIDQFLINDSIIFSKFLQNNFDGEIVLDLTNENEDGIILIQTKKNLFDKGGDENN
jgi:hypothetical protein